MLSPIPSPPPFYSPMALTSILYLVCFQKETIEYSDRETFYFLRPPPPRKQRAPYALLLSIAISIQTAR